MHGVAGCTYHPKFLAESLPQLRQLQAEPLGTLLRSLLCCCPSESCVQRFHAC